MPVSISTLVRCSTFGPIWWPVSASHLPIRLTVDTSFQFISLKRLEEKLWRGFLVTPQLLSVRWIGRRSQTNWKKTGTYGPHTYTHTHTRTVARKCQSSANSFDTFFQFISLKWLEEELWRDYRKARHNFHNFLNKSWRSFLVTPQLLSVRWIGRRSQTNWKKRCGVTWKPRYHSPFNLFSEMHWKKESNELEEDWHLRATVRVCACVECSAGRCRQTECSDERLQQRRWRRGWSRLSTCRLHHPSRSSLQLHHRSAASDLWQWLKYKFGAQELWQIWGSNVSPTVSWSGPSQPDRTVNGCVGPGNARQQL